MKKKQILSGLMLMAIILLTGCSLDNRVIEKPVFLTRNTTSIEVSKVTLTDSTTVLDIYAKYRPKYWIKIGPKSFLTDDKGNVYPIQTGVGIELGKEFWMPESGEAEFQLVFPRLRKGAKYIDFSEEPEVEGGFKIWGIQLKGNELPKLSVPEEVLSQEVDKDAPLTVPALKYGEAVVKGKVLDYQPGMPATLTLIQSNPLAGYDMNEINIEEDGTFEHAMNVLGVSVVILNYGDNGVELFAAPDETSEVYLNLRECARMNSRFHKDDEPYGKPFYYNGPLEGVVREKLEINKLMLSQGTGGEAYDFTQKPEVLLAEYKKNELAKVEKIRELLAQSTLSQASKDYLEAHAFMQMLLGLQLAPDVLAGHYSATQQNMDRTALYDFYDKVKSAKKEDYIDKELYGILNTPVALLDGSFGMLVKTAPDVLKTYGLGEGLFSQMIQTAQLYKGIQDFVPLTDEQKEEAKSLPEPNQQYLMAMNDKLLTTIEANKKKTGFRVNEAGEVANEDLFASIISKYSGKVLLVDFWATWCGPCRQANTAMIPMKEELKDKDIVYVYITGETSPKGTWENMIPNIHGEHFRVTDKQWAYLGKAMGIEGVPTYFVIDREGNIKYKSVGFPGVAKMKEELLKVFEN